MVRLRVRAGVGGAHGFGDMVLGQANSKLLQTNETSRFSTVRSRRLPVEQNYDIPHVQFAREGGWMGVGGAMRRSLFEGMSVGEGGGGCAKRRPACLYMLVWGGCLGEREDLPVFFWRLPQLNAEMCFYILGQVM